MSHLFWPCERGVGHRPFSSSAEGKGEFRRGDLKSYGTVALRASHLDSVAFHASGHPFASPHYSFDTLWLRRERPLSGSGPALSNDVAKGGGLSIGIQSDPRRARTDGQNHGPEPP